MFIISVQSNPTFNPSFVDGYFKQLAADFYLSKSQEEELAEIMRREQGDRIDDQRDVRDRTLRPLAPATIFMKGSSMALKRTGALRNSIRKYRVKDGYDIKPNENRESIASWTHYGTSKMRPFGWFGYEPGTQLDYKVDRFLDDKLKKI